MNEVAVDDFADWRERARLLLRDGAEPEAILWRDVGQPPTLFPPYEFTEGGPDGRAINVPKEFVSLAGRVACHRDPERWGLLYAALWRLTHGEKQLLHVATDPVVNRLGLLEKAVRRDVHKTHAFVRFRRVEDGEGGEVFVAWHRPDHRTLRLSVPFFRERFAAMKWAILTPDGSALWDGKKLYFGPASARELAPESDELEDLWRTYYRAIFNPARLKLKAMKKELPVRFGDLLPEASLIPELIREAPARVEEMIERQRRNEQG